MNQVDKTIKRVTEMEAIMDQALRIMDNSKESPETFLGFQSEIKKLEDYYSSQAWIEDFALDEEDMLEIMKLDKSSSLFFDHTNPDIVEWFDEMVEDGKNRQ